MEIIILCNSLQKDSSYPEYMSACLHRRSMGMPIFLGLILEYARSQFFVHSSKLCGDMCIPSTLHISIRLNTKHNNTPFLIGSYITVFSYIYLLYPISLFYILISLISFILLISTSRRSLLRSIWVNPKSRSHRFTSSTFILTITNDSEFNLAF